MEIIKVSVADLPAGCCPSAEWLYDAEVAALFQVYLEARRQEQQNHQQNLKMLSDEVSQIQEVSNTLSLELNTLFPGLKFIFCMFIS